MCRELRCLNIRVSDEVDQGVPRNRCCPFVDLFTHSHTTADTFIYCTNLLTDLVPSTKKNKRHCSSVFLEIVVSFWSLQSSIPSIATQQPPAAPSSGERIQVRPTKSHFMTESASIYKPPGACSYAACLPSIPLIFRFLAWWPVSLVSSRLYVGEVASQCNTDRSWNFISPTKVSIPHFSHSVATLYPSRLADNQPCARTSVGVDYIHLNLSTATYRSRPIIMRILETNEIVPFVFGTAKARLAFLHTMRIMAKKQ